MSYYAINADGEGYMYDGEAADEEPSSSEENGFDGLHGVPFLWKWGELAPSPVD